MRNEVLLALITKMIEERLNGQLLEITSSHRRGLRGFKGEPGVDGKSFSIEEHSDQIKSWAKEYALKFSDLTEEQISELRGPRGKDGKDGKSFLLEEHIEFIRGSISEHINSISTDLKFGFKDLTENEIELLRGPRGQRGKSGKDFVFEENREFIRGSISEHINSISTDLKLGFKDLTENEIELLRGPRGQRGKSGKDFVFEEHREFFEGLKLKFTDLSPIEIENLKLKFSDLTDEDRDSLKLKFSDLTDEDIIKLKGARGQRGRPGISGEKGDSVIGPRGPVGPRGMDAISIPGRDGKDGVDGKDAPTIYDIGVSQVKDYFTLLFKFSDGSEIETPEVQLPTSKGFTGLGGGFSSPYIPAPVPPAPSSSGIVLIDVDCDLTVYIGAAVRMAGSGGVDSVMSDWTSLELVSTLDYQIFSSNVAVNALADSWANSNVIGIVESKSVANKCNIRVTGVTDPIFLGLLVSEEYYLSDTDPGDLVTSALAPVDSGTVLLKLGQPFSGSEFLVAKGERTLRL